MAENSDISFALEYHEATKYSEVSVRSSAYSLDWNNRPFPFKVYKDIHVIPLPRGFPSPDADALSSISGVQNTDGRRGEPFGISELAELLFFSAGLTRKIQLGGETLYMRAASATGALYPIEVYVVCQELEGLEAGVYHHNPLDFGLVKLRGGDYRAKLAALSGTAVGDAPVTFVFTSLAWRNAWKYQARSYRHWFWDAGVMLANLLSVAAAVGLEAKVITGFVDSELDLLLGLKAGKEATVALVPVGLGKGKPPDTSPPLAAIEPKVKPLSSHEVEFPEIWRIHQASTLKSAEGVARWTAVSYDCERRDEGARSPEYPLKPNRVRNQAKLDDAILRRGSTRRFAAEPISFSQLSSVLEASSSPIPSDFLGAGGSLTEVYLVANSVEELPSGSYFFDSKAAALKQLRRGEFRRTCSYLCLEQPLLGQASVLFSLMAPLRKVLATYGNRGYRAAQLEGGIRAGRVYLSACSLGIGASGTTFYDDAVTEFFSPHAKGRVATIAVGVGVPAYKAKSGIVLPQFLR